MPACFINSVKDVKNPPEGNSPPGSSATWWSRPWASTPGLASWPGWNQELGGFSYIPSFIQ